ncbi:MAG: restriction endonuclease [Hydrogenophilales bacterium 16-64-46]|nr:MAG: restriction endonuclease [Hydrogenophilales bacterium 12-64-13]OYZ05526.1 MAG: restriction endonuclease [Hydrogenophilales bacterium 16-64-46]OZA40106.1 MAG: restriction endonuclease [Hydrogenophilales bacterium 17-64-34]HQT00372.1 restriction endonuclease [Thiobacillus sp.]
MAIPDFQSVFMPLLKACADGGEHTKQELLPLLARQFGLTGEELLIKLASGKQGMFDNRVGWAKSYLKQAGLLENLRRGVFRITDRGLQVLNENPQPLNVRYLKRFPEFVVFNAGKPKDEGKFVESVTASQDTPDELIAGGYKQLRETLAIELLERIKTVSPSRFEELVVELLLKMGYGGTQEDAGRVVGKSGDGGIDGIINEDRLGLDVIYIQAKRWEADVGRPEIQKFVGALAGNKASKGIFITSSGFSRGATDYASQVNHRVVLIDGSMLAELMMDYDLGVSTKDVYTVKRLDTDYFEEE